MISYSDNQFKGDINIGIDVIFLGTDNKTLPPGFIKFSSFQIEPVDVYLKVRDVLGSYQEKCQFTSQQFMSVVFIEWKKLEQSTQLYATTIYPKMAALNRLCLLFFQTLIIKEVHAIITKVYILIK